MAGINGIVITLKAPDADGAMTQVERPVFATARRHPELLAKLKAIARADIAETAAARRHALANDALVAAATSDDVDACQKAAEATADAVQAASEAVFAAVRAFVLEGFMGAGYTSDAAERYADLVPAERIAELKARCMLGGGIVDFTKGS